MFFASAAFLAGLALLTIPWWLHRLNAHTNEQRTFSSLFLMRPSEAPVNMRKQLQHLTLLALRWLLLIAACLAFSQPIIRLAGTETATEEAVEHRLIVLDTSLSMSRNDSAPLLAARAEVRDLISDLPGGAKAALVAAADELTLLVPLTDDTVRLTGTLAGIEPASTRLAMAGLMERVSTLADTLLAPGERVRIYLVSDFQASGLPDQFNALISGTVWPTELIPVVDADDAAGNRAIARLHPGANNTLDVTVQSFAAPGAEVTVALAQNDETIGRATLFVGENGNATANFALPAIEADSRRREAVSWTATLTPEDALAADNVRRLVKTDTVTAPLPVLGADDRAWAYLRAAVEAAAPRFAPERTSTPETDAAPVVVVLGSATLAGGNDRALARYLEAGGAVFLTVDTTTRSNGRLPLIDAPLAPDRLNQSPRGVVASDASHPVLTGFANWQDLTVFQALTPASSENTAGVVLLALDDGTALLTEHRIGSGRLLILGTALDPGWSTLVVRPAFVAFMANVLGYLAEDVLPAEALAGEPFAIPVQNVQLFDAAGTRVLGLSDTVGRPTVTLAEPGLYQLRTPASTRYLAVNVHPAESDLTRVAEEVLDSWRETADGPQTAANRAVAETRALLEARAADAPAARPPERELPLAPWLLAVLAVLVLIEAVYANVFRDRTRGHPSTPPEAEAAP